MDSRIIKTRREIRNTFLELLKEYPYEKITIKLLCERAFIARPTLYAHYNSVQDVLVDCVDSLYEKSEVEAFFSEISLESYKSYFGFVRANRAILKILFANNLEGVIFRCNKKYIGKEGLISLPEFEDHPEKQKLSKRFALYLSGYLFGLVDFLECHDFEIEDEQASRMADNMAKKLVANLLADENKDN